MVPRRVWVRVERESGEEREGLFAVAAVREAEGQGVGPAKALALLQHLLKVPR